MLYNEMDNILDMDCKFYLVWRIEALQVPVPPLSPTDKQES